MKNLLVIVFCLTLFSCSENNTLNSEKIPADTLNSGDWLLTFHLEETINAPSNFTLHKVDSTYKIVFTNASEKIAVTDIFVLNNQITIKDPVFNTWFEGEIINPNEIKGFWFKNDTSYKIPFTANFGTQPRFTSTEEINENNTDISGKWEVHFSNNTPEDHYEAIGQFQQDNDKITGTFMTETGDYRFLEGNVYGNKFALSCYDGAHLFLFKAEVKNDSLVGTFWSGNSWKEPWIAFKNESFKLTDPDSLTYLKEGYSKLAFDFPNTEGENISLTDDQFKNKVVIVNIMGSWCPNCKDETAYLAELHNKNNDNGLEVIALSFDNSDKDETIKKLNKIKRHFNANYDFLLAGKSSKKEAAKSLPMLNHIMSYPTSIFIDRKGNIRKIRTGFYGPGTDGYYTRYIEKTNDFVDKLLAEEVLQ